MSCAQAPGTGHQLGGGAGAHPHHGGAAGDQGAGRDTSGHGADQGDGGRAARAAGQGIRASETGNQDKSIGDTWRDWKITGEHWGQMKGLFVVTKERSPIRLDATNDIVWI